MYIYVYIYIYMSLSLVIPCLCYISHFLSFSRSLFLFFVPCLTDVYHNTDVFTFLTQTTSGISAHAHRHR